MTTLKYVDHLASALDCPICLQTLSDPVLLSDCQHIFCRSCLWSALQTAALCPIDRRPVIITSSTLEQEHEAIKPAPSILRSLLNELKCVCTQCEWQGRRDQFDLHMCSNSAPCQYCNEPTSHTSCPLQPIACPHAPRGCLVTCPQRDMVDHLVECPYEALKGLLHHFDQRFEQLQSDHQQLQQRTHQFHTILTDQFNTLQHQLNTLQMEINTINASLDINRMDDSVRWNQELTVLRAGLDGLRRQLWNVMMERESVRKPLRTGALLGLQGSSTMIPPVMSMDGSSSNVTLANPPTKL